MPVVPDDKNWTWVLERTCPECRFDTTTVGRDEVGPVLDEVVEAWDGVLDGRPEAALRQRPSEDRWSDLEYACHVRDVFRLYDQRLELMLSQDDPLFPNWDQDATAVANRYSDQDPAEVAVALSEAGQAIASRFAGVTGGRWQRTGRRSDGASFTVETFARYFIHDPVHHLYDVTGQRR